MSKFKVQGLREGTTLVTGEHGDVIVGRDGHAELNSKQEALLRDRGFVLDAPTDDSNDDSGEPTDSDVAQTLITTTALPGTDEYERYANEQDLTSKKLHGSQKDAVARERVHASKAEHRPDGSSRLDDLGAQSAHIGERERRRKLQEDLNVRSRKHKDDAPVADDVKTTQVDSDMSAGDQSDRHPISDEPLKMGEQS